MIKAISRFVILASLFFAPFLAFSNKCESIFKNRSIVKAAWAVSGFISRVNGRSLQGAKLEEAVGLSKKRREPDIQHAKNRGPVDNAEDRGLEAYVEDQVDRVNDVVDNAEDRVGNVASNIEKQGIVDYAGDKAERLFENVADFISQDDSREYERKKRDEERGKKPDIIDDAVDFFTRF